MKRLAVVVLVGLYVGMIAAPAFAATLTWTAPSQFTDGSTLTPATDLSGYNIYVDDVKAGTALPTSTGAVIAVAFGPHAYFVTAVAKVSGKESAMSNVISNAGVPDTRTPKPPTLVQAVIAFLKRLFGHFA